MIRTIVVGSGAAGAPLAARLSEDPNREVVLIEAGSSELPTSAELLEGASLPAAVPGHPANWGFAAELAPDVPYVIPRGKVLGGSSAINGGYFVRAQPDDFAQWARVGGADWQYGNAVPLLAGLETDLDYGSAAGHGDAGPIRVGRQSLTTGPEASFRAAARELGFPEEPDKNALDTSPGVGPVPTNIVDGVRVNTAMSYLAEAQDRPNLTVLGGTRALRVRIESGRATGVEALTEGSLVSEVIEADEVVLCAGAIVTPQLLMLSGIGPRHHLDGLGLPCLVDLPVGEAFHDHPNLTLLWRAAHPMPVPERSGAFPVALNFDSSGQEGLHEAGDLEILPSVVPESALFGDIGDPSASNLLRCIIALQRPRSRGRLSLRSADPLEPPRIEHRYLRHAEDRARLRTGVRTAALLLRTRAFSDLFQSFVDLDERTLDDDERLDAWILTHLGTAIHMCATAPMGSVVDGAGLVHGISGLRVADTSILPTTPSRGPFATAVFIGELIARQMLRSQPAESSRPRAT